ncbi:MAG: hypothetical protein FXF49_08725 [Flexistipes sinusarabici]|uniref:Uncharacterized protein n=1 Tax=Flexistipes sinusarabici TaxID=2352 RepID=A0A5D0MGW2_FLESI|nr:hypothetical protein [Flexistipes sinusarabici]TYB32954.1 MAG: hypothetical protein FXF49_08725 [Flexistipes sinusarabici]
MLRKVLSLFKSEDKVFLVFLILLLLLAINCRNLSLWEKTLPAKIGGLPLNSFIIEDEAENKIAGLMENADVETSSSVIAEYTDGRNFIQIVSVRARESGHIKLINILENKLHFYKSAYRIKNASVEIFEGNMGNRNFYALCGKSRVILINSSVKLNEGNILNIYGFLRRL